MRGPHHLNPVLCSIVLSCLLDQPSLLIVWLREAQLKWKRAKQMGDVWSQYMLALLETCRRQVRLVAVLPRAMFF